jgi:hypothetical protein
VNIIWQEEPVCLTASVLFWWDYVSGCLRNKGKTRRTREDAEEERSSHQLSFCVRGNCSQVFEEVAKWDPDQRPHKSTLNQEAHLLLKTIFKVIVWLVEESQERDEVGSKSCRRDLFFEAITFAFRIVSSKRSVWELLTEKPDRFIQILQFYVLGNAIGISTSRVLLLHLSAHFGNTQLERG